MKRTVVLGVAICFLAASLARGEVVSRRWGGAALRVSRAKAGQRLIFDLSDIPRGAKVHHASLYCFTRGGRQPKDPALIHLTEKLDAEGDPVLAAKPLKIEPPWYRSFDAAEAVGRWVRDPDTNLGLTVKRFEGFDAGKTYLEVRYEGKAQDVPEQVAGVRAVHHHGQTFIAWTEHKAFRPKKDEIIWVEKFSERGDVLAEGPGDGWRGMPNHPAITLTTLRRLQGLAVRLKPSGFQGIKPLRRVRKVLPITYRVYRHAAKITAANIHQAEMLAEVQPLSGFDQEVYKIHFQGEYINQREEPKSVIPTYCLDKGKALAPGEGLYVHTAARAGKSYYAVTTALGGTENLSQIGDANSLSRPVEEKPGTPEPVLQWVQEDYYRKDPTEYWYRYWASPPYVNVPSRSFRVAVAVSDKFKGPGPLTIGSISGAFNVRGSLNLPRADRVTILVKRQLAWMPALFYNQGMGTLRAVTESKVDYYCERYMSRMIKWVMGKYQIDRSKISGSLMHFGLRHPEIFTRMSMGSYTAGYDLRWAPGGPSMPRVLGPMGIKTTKGEDAWKMYSVSEYVNTYPDRDIPFLVCVSGTGKDSGHTCEFGWQDDPRGWRGLLKARQPFVAAWSLGVPRELSLAFGKMRWDVSIPAFSNCSLDNNPGNGDAADGDYYGCINGWLLWDDKDQVDRPDRWEMTVWVISSCPDDACTVDITPRHCKAFKPKKGEKFKWTNTSLKEKQRVRAGQVTADRWGLVTIKAVKVGKGKNRIVIGRL